MALKRKFFERPTLVVAKDLLGKFLVRRIGKKTKNYLITEIEAYSGFNDRASHAFKGMTERNAPMFGEAGKWYVYFTYGMHYMLNIVTGPKNYPAAILIRGIEGINGPGRITKQLKINKKFNNKKATQKTRLWIEDNSNLRNSKLEIRDYPRIGVAYAGPIWSKKNWRFVLIIDNCRN